MKHQNLGKAISGGTPVGADEIARMTAEYLAELKARLSPLPIAKTEDVLSQRVAEELAYTQRLLEIVEAELARRGVGGPAVARVEEAEQLLGDLSQVMEARDRCEGVGRVATPDLKRRLLRRGLDGKAPPCSLGDAP